jgi:hypothetical protein
MRRINHVTLLIGAMKCGTTSLFHYITQHPQVCPSIRKEPMFFSSSAWTEGLSSYQKLWSSYNPMIHKTVIEASTEYTKFPDFPNVAERIQKFSLDYQIQFKFIYIMRDPLDLIASALRHAQDHQWASSKAALIPHFLNVADYAKQLDNYYERFPEQDILLIRFEELTESIPNLMQKLCVFLDLDRSIGNLRVFNKIYNSAAERRHTGTLSPTHQDWSLSEDEKQFVLNKLEPSLLKLKSKYDVDGSKWLETSRSLS